VINNSINCDTPEAIAFFALCSLRGRLKLEIAGMKGRVSIMKVCKVQGFKGKNKNEMLAQVEQKIEEAKKARAV
jgi:hypothetical protein